MKPSVSNPQRERDNNSTLSRTCIDSGRIYENVFNVLNRLRRAMPTPRYGCYAAASGRRPKRRHRFGNVTFSGVQNLHSALAKFALREAKARSFAEISWNIARSSLTSLIL